MLTRLKKKLTSMITTTQTSNTLKVKVPQDKRRWPRQMLDPIKGHGMIG